MKKLIFSLAFIAGTLSVGAQTLKINSSMYNRAISQSFSKDNNPEIGTSFTLSKGKGWKLKVDKAQDETNKYAQPFTHKELKRDLDVTTNRQK